MNNSEYPALAQFLGAYFHQDFLEEFRNPDDAIAVFMAEVPKESIQAVCSELKEVIPLTERIDKPEEFLWHVLGCYYFPEADSLTVVDWLNHVRDKLCGQPET